MLGSRLDGLFLVALVATVSLAACGSDGVAPSGTPDGAAGALEDGGPGGGGSDRDGPLLPDADMTDADGGDSAIPDGPDVPPASFPSTVPLLFGYTLVDAFPGTFISGAMDMEWPAGSTQPFVLQRGGHIVRLHGDGTRDVVLDFSPSVAFRAEAGALGMALHPKFADPVAPQPYVYVWYNADPPPTHQRLSRFTWNPATKVFDLASQLILVEQLEGFPEHNGGRLRFGLDGFLYFGNGDDLRTDVTTQTLVGGLFSGVFRIDVDSRGGAISHAPPKQPLNAVTQGYFIPNGNPFVGVANVAEEYFALGLRNPYSFNFDRGTGNLWLGDVGETWREEIDLVVSGGNYGWPFYEGKKQYRPGAPTIGTLKAPLYDYAHSAIADLTSVICGYVYRGAALPELAGKLVFSDWPVGRVWALDTTTGKRTSLDESNIDYAPVGFGQDGAGEVYLISWSKILKVVRAPAPHAVPKKLSATGIFRNVSTLKTPTALVPYAIRSPFWSDGAAAQRWAYVPGGQTATMTADGTVTLPTGSLLIEHLELPAAAQPVGARTKRLETRVLVVATDGTYGVTYRWNSAGTDADLVVEAADEAIGDVAPAEARTWHYPSAGECWSCHGPEDRVLGFRGEQMNFTPAGSMNQLAAFAARGLFDAASIGTSPAPLASPSDVTASIDDRASAYLAVNCSSCHRPGSSYLGGGDTWNALPNVPAASRGLVNLPHHNGPMASALGLPNAPLVAPGNPNGSILRARLDATDGDVRMQPLWRTRRDPLGVSIIDAWITQLPP